MSAIEKPVAPDPLKALMDAWEKGLLRKKRQEKGSTHWRPANVYASKRRRCVRAMALDMLHPEDDPFDKPLQFERMEQGNEAENAVVARLYGIGAFCDPPFKVAEQQHRFEVKDRDGTALITGKMDGRLRFETGDHPPFEIKSGRSYDDCETVEDLDRGIWSRSALDQLLAYLYADDPKHYPNGEPWGFVFVRRFSALPVPIRVNLMDHLGRIEAWLQEARQAVDARHERGPLPDFIQDPSECRRCPHLGKSCTPPLDYGPGVQAISDPDLIMAAQIREQTRASRDEYERADKLLKDRLRGVETGLLGDYMVSGKWSPATKYDYPEEVKKQYARVEAKGRFTLSIERVAAPQKEAAS